jgi:protocatechuate 3,4-dioxygenase beta subunit
MFLQTAVAKATTGIEGKYTFQGVAPGEYVVYAQHKTNFFAVDWCIEVRVQAGYMVRLDLFNENASRLVNKN